MLLLLPLIIIKSFCNNIIKYNSLKNAKLNELKTALRAAFLGGSAWIKYNWATLCGAIIASLFLVLNFNLLIYCINYKMYSR